MTCSGNYRADRQVTHGSDPMHSIQITQHALALLSMAENLNVPLQFYTATCKAFRLLSAFRQEQYSNLHNMVEQVGLLCTIQAQLSSSSPINTCETICAR